MSKLTKLNLMMILNETDNILDYYNEIPYLLLNNARAGQFYALKKRIIELDSKDYNGVTPAMMAILHNSYELTECLLIHGADVHIRLIEDKTLLHYAVIMQNEKIAKLLLDFSKFTDDVSQTIK